MKKILKTNKNLKNVYLLQMTTKAPLINLISTTLNVQSLNIYLSKLNNLQEQLQKTFNVVDTTTALNDKWWFCLNFYKKLFLTPLLDNLLVVKTLQKTALFKKFYRIFFTFKRGRFFVNLTNFNKTKNYLFISTGMFIQYFQYKKSLRKNKILKVLIAKYLRKFLLILQLKYVSLHFSSTPVMLQEILTNLTAPLIKPLKNPLTLKTIDEDQSFTFRFTFLYFFFQKSKNFGIFKLKKKGRVKRRILRKLIKINNVLD